MSEPTREEKEKMIEAKKKGLLLLLRSISYQDEFQNSVDQEKIKSIYQLLEKTIQKEEGDE